MHSERPEIRGAAIHIVANSIAAIGTEPGPPDQVDEVADLNGHIVCPDLINTHHHTFQSLTRAIPTAQDASLLGALQALDPIWARLTPEMIRVSTQTAIAELLLSGRIPSPHVPKWRPAGRQHPGGQLRSACGSTPRAAR